MIRKPKFQWRWMLTAAVAVLLGAVGIVALRQHVILQSFATLEAEEARKDLLRCQDAIDRETQHLSRLAGDWAMWDDTYRFVADGNAEYIESNLQWASLEKASGINLIQIVRSSGEVVWGEVYDSSRGGTIDTAALAGPLLDKAHILFRIDAAPNGHVGLILTELGPMLVNSRPILTSSGDGPARGVFIMGRFLNDKTLKTLAQQVRVPFAVRDTQRTIFGPVERHVLARLSSEPAVLLEEDENTLLAYGLIKDIAGNPALLLNARLPRSIMARGRSVGRLASISLLITLSAVGLLIALTLTKYAFGLKRRNTYVEELIAARTAELHAAKEQAETARENAEAANRAKGDFLANMSHEVRTPLNGILGMAEVAERLSTESRQKRAIACIVSEAESLLQILNSVLDFSKIESNAVELEKIPFHLRDLLESVSQSMDHLAQRKGLAFAVAISPGVPSTVVGDPVRLRQVLVNLTANAIKFTGSGAVRIGVEVEENLDNRSRLRFLVHDTGIGIAPAKRGIIFEPFTQADESTTRKYGGTGLGTAICRKIVHLMGGEIGVESEVGKGSTFWFSLALEKSEDEADPQLALGAVATESRISTPRFDADTPGIPTDAHDPLPGPLSVADPKTACILLAEDYPVNQQVARMHLESAGYRVEVAENGERAVEAFARNRHDLILMDIQMPVLDGFGATAAIRAMEADRNARPPSTGQRHGCGGTHRRIPIIAMTAHALQGYARKCRDMGMDDYITKPLKRDQLLVLVDKWTRCSVLEEQAAIGLSESAAAKGSPASAEDPIDLDCALAEFMGKQTLLADTLRGFLGTVAVQIEQIDRAITSGNAEAVRQAAHQIKGGSANLRAGRLAETASALEAASQYGTREAPAIFERFKAEYLQLRDYVHRIGYGEENSENTDHR